MGKLEHCGIAALSDSCTINFSIWSNVKALAMEVTTEQPWSCSVIDLDING